MTRRHLIPIALLALILATPAVADLDARAVIDAAPPVGDFPDDDIVVLYHQETVTVDDDGRVTRTVHSLRRLQNQWAMRNRSDVRVAWDSARQDLEIILARTFMRDGAVVPTPDNGFNEVTPDAVRRAGPFLDIREMVISHVGTEPGCVVELSYVIRDREPGPAAAGGVCWLGGKHPVLTAEVRVEGAPTMLRNGDGLAIVHDRSGLTRVENLPAYPAEGVGGHSHAYIPHVAWSTVKTPAALAEPLRRASEAAAGAAAGLQAWLAAARTDADVLTETDLVQRIAAVASDGITGVHLPDDRWGRTPRLAEDVFRTAVGTDWERAVVALTLLREAGYEPELGFFGRDPLTAGEPLPTARLTRLRVVVQIDRQNWWLAPERGAAWPGDCDLVGWTGLFLDTAGGQRVYTVPPRAGVCRWSANIAPEGDGWCATGDLVLRGPYRPEDLTATELGDRLAARLLPDGEVASLDVRTETPSELAIRVTVTGAVLGEVTGDLVIRDVPWPDDGVLGHLPDGFRAEAPDRTAPLWIEAPGREEVSLRITIPDGWTVDAPATAENHLAAPAGTFTRRSRIENGDLIIERALDLARGRVEPGDVPALRTVLAAALQDGRRPLVLIAE